MLTLKPTPRRRHWNTADFAAKTLQKPMEECRFEAKPSAFVHWLLQGVGLTISIFPVLVARFALQNLLFFAECFGKEYWFKKKNRALVYFRFL